MQCLPRPDTTVLVMVSNKNSPWTVLICKGKIWQTQNNLNNFLLKVLQFQILLYKFQQRNFELFLAESASISFQVLNRT